jgi:hypothetical protein
MMAFTIYVRGPGEQGIHPPDPHFETYDFMDSARYEVLPSGALIIDTDGAGSCWVLAPERWQWIRTSQHLPNEQGHAGSGQIGADSGWSTAPVVKIPGVPTT